MFSDKAARLHHSFNDPAAVEGSEEIRLDAFRKVRDELRAHLKSFSKNSRKHRGPIESTGLLEPEPVTLIKFRVQRWNGMTCEEKARLASEYQETSRKYADAVAELTKKMGTSAKAEYEWLTRAVDEARVKSEQSRLALEQHVATHNC